MFFGVNDRLARGPAAVRAARRGARRGRPRKPPNGPLSASWGILIVAAVLALVGSVVALADNIANGPDVVAARTVVDKNGTLFWSDRSHFPNVQVDRADDLTQGVLATTDGLQDIGAHADVLVDLRELDPAQLTLTGRVSVVFPTAFLQRLRVTASDGSQVPI